MFKRTMAVTVLFLFLLSSQASAAESYGPMVKLGRGITNMVCCFMEIPANVQKACGARGVASGFAEGIVSGICFTGGRLLSGAYDVITFPIPLPACYRSIMKPDYVFQSVTSV